MTNSDPSSVQTNINCAQLLGQAISAFQAGNFEEACRLCELVLKEDKNNVVALHLAGVLKALRNDLPSALTLLDRALILAPSNPDLYADKGKILKELDRPEEALLCFDKALSINERHPIALEHKASILLLLKRPEDTIEIFDLLLQIAPSNSRALNNRGLALADLGRYDQAIEGFRSAADFDQRNPDIWANLGNVLCKSKSYDDALAAYSNALTINPDFAEAWLGRGNVFGELKHYDEAFAAHDKALALKPDLAEAWLGCGNVFYGLKRYDESFAAYDKALALKPDLAEAWLVRGNVFGELKHYDEAFAAYDKAVALKPDFAEAWLGRGNIFYDLKRYDESFAAYDKALALKPDLASAEGARLHTKMRICDWLNFDTECANLSSSVNNRKANTAPFPFLAIPSSAGDQLQCAKLWIAEKFRPSQKPLWRGGHYNHDRIRIAYVSADFRNHAVSSLIAGMFECHDKSRFELTAISIGPDDNSEIRQRLKRSFDHFVDATTLSDEKIASRIRKTEIDILIDLSGFTRGGRPNVFALRPAPIQVNYLGYPGTMGTSYIDYIIADQTIIPDEYRRFYSEKIAVLPNTYQPNDRKRIISDKAFTRSDVGLPSQGFVFCCFNNNYKIIPRVFDGWMRVLKQVEGSVLWLLEDNASTVSNLKKEAVARGVGSERLVFAKRMPLPEHLARHKFADLFLDTLPYNAHTTASDALWAGLPVLTCIGETFAGRVAASLLKAIRLPELITTTLEAYEQTATELATHPEKLAAIKHRLAENRLTTPLFDTKLFTKHIEEAYSAMYERYQAKLPPDHIIIPN